MITNPGGERVWIPKAWNVRRLFGKRWDVGWVLKDAMPHFKTRRVIASEEHWKCANFRNFQAAFLKSMEWEIILISIALA